MVPKGTLIQVICKSNETALKIENVQAPLGCKVDGAPSDPQDVAQLWFVDKINDGKDYELGNALSDLVLEDGGGIVHMKKGNWAKYQMFKLQKAPFEGFYEYYWVKLSKNQGRALSFEGVLRCVDFDQNDEKQLFRFETVPHNLMVNRTVLLASGKAPRKVVDVPAASDREGEEMVQWEYNNRFNQRWLLVKTGGVNSYQIQSFKTGLNLDIYGESKKPGTRVIQYRRTAAPNQLWVLEHQEGGLHHIRSALSSDLYLAVENESVKDGAKIVVSATPFLWRVTTDI